MLNYIHRIKENIPDRKITTSVDLIDKPILPPRAVIHLFRVVQESIQNAIKHADASEINYELVSKDQHIWIKINDNGKGFDLNNQSYGHGLHNMLERSERIEAHFKISSTPGTGTQVQIQLKTA